MTQSLKQQTDERQQRLLLIGGAVVVLVALVTLIGVGGQWFRGGRPTVNQMLETDKHPIPAWIVQDAQKCKGDFSKLAPEEQQKILALYPGQSAWIITAAAYNSKP